MSERQRAIRHIYRENDRPFDALWKWARRGDGKRERWRRFAALQQWAQGQRDNSHGDERERWNNRRKAYRRQKRKILRRINDAPADLGTGPNQGSTSIVDDVVVPVYVKHGIPVTSRKRWATFGNPSSDHWFGNTDADAADGGVARAFWLHAQIADAFRRAGIPLDRTPVDFAACFCTTPNDNRYRYQGIAETHGTGPHYHGGVKRS